VAWAAWLDLLELPFVEHAADGDGMHPELAGGLVNAEQTVAFWRVCGHSSMIGAAAAASPTPRMGKGWEKPFPIPTESSGVQRGF
jgi:hypothetical protein